MRIACTRRAVSERPTLARFLAGELDASAFPHSEHVRMSFELLRVQDFAQSVLSYSRALQRMTARTGKPEIFNQTITVAFLALVAERMQAAVYSDFAAFEAANPDLLDRSVLDRWYPRARLASEAARRVFLLPEAPR
jgi:hypothetical protein